MSDYFEQLRKQKEIINLRESMQSDWRKDLISEEEQHPYVDVMPSTDQKAKDAVKKKKEEKKVEKEMEEETLPKPPENWLTENWFSNLFSGGGKSRAAKNNTPKADPMGLGSAKYDGNSGRQSGRFNDSDDPMGLESDKYDKDKGANKVPVSKGWQASVDAVNKAKEDGSQLAAGPKKDKEQKPGTVVGKNGAKATLSDKPPVKPEAPKPPKPPTAPKPTEAPKPPTAPKPTRDRMANASKADRMAAWAKANPKLAAAKAERDRTRGTSSTTNPMLKNQKSSMPKAAPKPATAPKPSTAPEPVKPVTEETFKEKQKAARKRLDLNKKAIESGKPHLSPYGKHLKPKYSPAADPWGTHASDAKAHRKEDNQ